MFMELAHYVYPKRKTVDIRIAEPEPLEQVSADDLIRYLDKTAERLRGESVLQPEPSSSPLSISPGQGAPATLQNSAETAFR